MIENLRILGLEYVNTLDGSLKVFNNFQQKYCYPNLSINKISIKNQQITNS